MESFVVSARKYRPAVFSHVLGQTPITTTLKNAIKDKHLAQAFLFCGPRGVGKTTCARILAKAINCQQLTAEIEPCNVCAACKSFNQSSSFNVYELDAASNNSVEDIRGLVEQVRYPPQAAQYKVYIIDEVHMLSQAAFNAFLKTLEEPPSYAIFILATTEKQKVIPTILSRCQIFDFQRIQPQAIVQQLKNIAAKENIAYEEPGLHLISQKADGALRDALSMFDLLVTFGAGKLTYEAALENLHVLDYTYYLKLIEALLQGHVADALLLYDDILRTGFDSLYFIGGLCEHLRNLLMCQEEATLPLLEVPQAIQAQYQAQATKAKPAFILRALQIVNQSTINYKSSQNKRLHIELCLIELAQLIDPLPNKAIPDIDPKLPIPQKPSDISTHQPGSSITPPTKTWPYQPQPASEPTTEKVTQSHLLADKPPKNDQQNSLQATIKLPQLAQLKASMDQPSYAPSNNHMATGEPTTIEKPVFTKALVSKHWQAYAEQLKAAGKIPAYRLLQQDIELNGSTILVKFTNAVQADMLAEIKEKLLAYLRTALQHASLDVQGRLIQAEKNHQPYTAQEKFKYLANKNPKIQLLQEQLQLRIVD